MSTDLRGDWNRIIEERWKRYQAGEEDALEEVLSYLMEFSLRVASKTCCAFINPQDEEAGIARLALWEAFQKFDPEKGVFLVFLGRVIRHRLIDFKRHQSRFKKYLFYDDWSYAGEETVEQQVEVVIDELARQQEIQSLARELQPFGISFAELPRVSPRQRKTREEALAAAGFIAGDPELRDYLMERKMLPIALLVERFPAKRKLLDRFRKYIITAAIVFIGDYTCVKEYVVPGGRGEKP